jgi:hypothetical protein
MNRLQHTKLVSITPPAAIKDNAAWTTGEIDTKDWDWLTIICYLGATDIAIALLKVQESNTSGSGFADVTGLVMGTSTNIDGATSALPSATDDNTFQVFEIDLRNRKRYIDLSATAGDGTTGTFFAALGILSRSKSLAPVSLAERGVNELLRV